MLEYVADQLRLRRNLFGISSESSDGTRQTFRLLDYACGTGNVSKALAPYITSVTGFDVSPGMVARYNEDANTQNASRHAVAGNMLSNPPYLLKDDDEKTDDSFLRESDWSNFDAVIVGLGFHHFQDYAGTLRKLGGRCRPGGIVGIIDLLPRKDVY